MSSSRRAMIRPRLRKDGSIAYQARWWERELNGGRKQRTATFNTEAEAKNHLARIRTAKSDGKHTTRAAGKTPMRQIGDEWLRGRQLELKRELISAGTYRTQESLYRTHVASAFDGREVATITDLDVQAWVDDRMERLAPSSLERVYSTILCPIFDLAVKRRCISDSPCSKEVRLPANDSREQRYCSTDEVSALADAIEPHGYPALSVLFLAYTGIRIGECLGLKKQYVDIAAREVRIEGQIIRDENSRSVYTRKLKTPKARRVVGIPSWLADLLALHLQGHDGEYVFCEKDGGFISYDRYKRAFSSARKRLALDDVHIHSLRHTFASLALARGADIYYVSKQMGHASISITADRYAHLCRGGVHRVADLFETVLENKVNHLVAI